MASILASCGDPAQTPPPPAKTMEAKTAPPIENSVISAGELKGQFITAGEDTPVIVIAPGSGPTDLDGNNLMGVSANSYKMLAQGLAAKGIIECLTWGDFKPLSLDFSG